MILIRENKVFKDLANKIYTRRPKTLNLEVRISIISDLDATDSSCTIQEDGKEDRQRYEDIRPGKKRD